MYIIFNKVIEGGLIIKKIGLLIFSLVLFGGCATGSIPNFYNGKYYMAGDDNCRYMRQLSENRIMCQNASKIDMGYRDAMTDQQLQMYMHQQTVDQLNTAIILQNRAR